MLCRQLCEVTLPLNMRENHEVFALTRVYASIYYLLVGKHKYKCSCIYFDLYVCMYKYMQVIMFCGRFCTTFCSYLSSYTCEQVFHCKNRIMNCDACKAEMVAHTYTHHLHTECPERIVHCKFACGRTFKARDIEKHEIFECVQPCKW